MENNLLFELVREELCDLVGDEGVGTTEAGCFCYNADYSWVSRAWVDHGQKPLVADFVVSPRTSEEVIRILKIANRHKVPVIPYNIRMQKS
jgi:FAD/FMN-containing dehydrogenase